MWDWLSESSQLSLQRALLQGVPLQQVLLWLSSQNVVEDLSYPMLPWPMCAELEAAHCESHKLKRLSLEDAKKCGLKPCKQCGPD